MAAVPLAVQLLAGVLLLLVVVVAPLLVLRHVQPQYRMALSLLQQQPALKQWKVLC
jgi:hypothetical protein